MISRFKNNRGEVTILTIATIISLLLSVHGTVSYFKLGDETDQVHRQIGQLQQTIKAQYDQAGMDGRMTQAQAQVLKYKVDQNWANFNALAKRWIERQDQVDNRQVAATAADWAFNLLGLGADKIAARIPGADRLARALAMEAKDGLSWIFLGGNAGATSTSFAMASQVEYDDIRQEVERIANVWAGAENDFQRSMLAAKIRIFVDNIKKMDIPPERKKEIYDKYAADLQRQGWRIPEVDFGSKRSVKKYIASEVRKYKAEKSAAPALVIDNLEIDPTAVKKDQVVKLSARVIVSGIAEGDLTADYFVDGAKIPTFLQTFSRLDVPALATAQYEVPKDAAEGKHEVKFQVRLKLSPEMAGNLGKAELTAEAGGSFAVIAPGDYSFLQAWYYEELHKLTQDAIDSCCKTRECYSGNCTAEVDYPCEKEEKPACCKIRKEKQEVYEDGKAKMVVVEICDVCECEISKQLTDWITTFETHLRDRTWFELHESFLPCYQKVLEDYLRDRRACLMEWAGATDKDRDGRCSDCFQEAGLKAEDATANCQKKACEEHCAAKGKKGAVQSMLLQECVCK